MTGYWRYAAGAALVALPFFGVATYHLHILILILLWSFIYTGWSLMGRFGLVSLGHGAFMGIGAYATAMLWNFYGLTPWIGIPIGLFLTALLAVIIGYPCFRFRIVGHYFALVTLALSEVVRLTLVAMRDHTGGSLGLTPRRAEEGASLYALQFADKETFYFIALAVWGLGLLIWYWVDRGMIRYAMDAIAEDEDAAAAVGIHVTRTKIMITVISACMTALGGALYAQYQMYISPDIVSGIGVSLQIVFAVVAGGIYVALGPTVGAAFTLLLAESLRVAIGTTVIGLDPTIYGIALILFIIFLPKGILGTAIEAWQRRSEGSAIGPAKLKKGA